MKHIKSVIEKVSERLLSMAAENRVVGQPISRGDLHVVPLCELGFGFGGGGGSGEAEADDDGKGAGGGVGGGGGGGVNVRPVAVLVVNGDDVKLERLG